MSNWLKETQDRLVRTATVGALRWMEESAEEVQDGSLFEDDAPAELQRIGRALSQLSREDAVLAAAGTLAQYRAAGHLLPRLHRRRDAAGVDERPLLPPPALRLLEMMLDGAFTPILPELIRQMDQAGGRVPLELIPLLLERGYSVSPLRPPIIGLIGRAGRRLAAEHPHWTYASAAMDHWDGAARIWSETPVARRRYLLTQLRLTDPVLGRELLQANWKQEANNTRVQLIQVLESGLTMADEPFLEAALDDRSDSVRRKAADLLARLDGSRLRQRMAEAVEPSLAWTPDAETRITVTPSDAVSAAAQRDGVPNRPMREKVRLQGAQISAMLGAVALSHWEEEWQATPREIVQAAGSSRWPRTLMTGWALAAERQHNAEWAEALLVEGDFQPAVMRAVSRLAPARFDALVAAHIDWSRPLEKESRFVKLVRRWHGEWTMPLAVRWVEAVEQTLAVAGAKRPPDSTVRAAIKQFSLHAPPAIVADVESHWFERLDSESPWHGTLCEAAATLDVRRRIQAALAEFPG